MTIRNRERPITIYALWCTEERTFKYVGQSWNPLTRYYQHIYQCRKGKTQKDAWLRELIAKGVKPKLIILEEDVLAEKAWGVEQTWIGRLGLAGYRLLNSGAINVDAPQWQGVTSI